VVGIDEAIEVGACEVKYCDGEGWSSGC